MIIENGSFMRRKKRFNHEFHEQVKLVSWLDENNILFYHVPNGGKRNILEAINFKKSGVKSGVPDICIPIPFSNYHGLYGELKAKKGGSLSQNQKWWLDELNKKGYYTFSAHGADEFIEHVKKYLGMNNV